MFAEAGFRVLRNRPTNPARVRAVLFVLVELFRARAHFSRGEGPGELSSEAQCHEADIVRVCGNNHFTEMCCGNEEGSYLRLIDSCITQLKARGSSRTCKESKEEEKRGLAGC